MSKLIYVSARHGAAHHFRALDITRLSSRLTPDNIVPKPPRVIEGEGILIGIFNPTETLPVQGTSVCLGRLFERRADWWQPGAEAPDGSYALFRGDGETLELVSDAVGSRTIWYAQTADLFIAATSQRAIVCLLQSYEPNEAVYPWMLSSGTLGPGLSWDRRIRCLGPDSRLRLDRRSWEVRVEQRPVAFVPEDLPRAEHERRLREALEATFAGLELEPGRWVLPLSGGYDSRAILLLLKERAGLRAVTWGTRAALTDRGSDAWVAKELAQHFGLTHEYYETDLSGEPVERIFERYLVAGEGRVDHIAGYMDGFALWKRLYETGCQGILRGDQAFGCRAVRDDREVYRNMGLTMLSDFSNVPPVLSSMAADQQRPAAVTRRDGETRAAWRDRIGMEFEMPVIFAALSDLKLAYLELIQPLLSRRILDVVRSLPDALRTDKTLFKAEIDRGLAMAYARRPAIAARGELLRQPEVKAVVTDRVRALMEHGGEIAPLARPVLDWMERDVSDGRRYLVTRMRRWTAWLNGYGNGESVIDPYRAGLRLYLIARMDEMLRSDTTCLPAHRATHGDGSR